MNPSVKCTSASLRDVRSLAKPGGRGRKTPISASDPGPKQKTEWVPHTEAWWRDTAAKALVRLLEIEKACVWPEVVAMLGVRGWLHQNLDASYSPTWSVQSHHADAARVALVREGVVVPLPAKLQGQNVVAFALASTLSVRGQATAVLETAASKRRLYRSFLAWCARKTMCGDIAEGAVDTALRSLAGTHLWLDPAHRLGGVRALLGRPLPAGMGPLDAAGHWAINRARPQDGFIPFAVEVKNVRSVLYPYDANVWDLLWKLGTYPDVVPVLVAHRIHFTTYRMFKDIGALGTELRDQLFSEAIEADTFQRVASGLHLHDAKRVDPKAARASLLKFFGATGPGQSPSFLPRWGRAAAIAAQYEELRDSRWDSGSRQEAFHAFAAEIGAAGLYDTGGWAPRHVVFPDEHDDRPDDDEYYYEPDY